MTILPSLIPMNRPRQLIIFLLFISLVSCKTYELTPYSLQQQYAGIDSTQLKMVEVVGPFNDKYSYLAHPNKSIELMNKEGDISTLPVTPSIEMRITHSNGKKDIFYLDRIFVTDSVVIGSKSRFAPNMSKSIRLNDIRKIEVQDGKKKFKYVY